MLRRKAVLLAVTALICAVLTQAAPGATAATTLAAPTSLSSSSQSTTAIAVRWSTVTGASGYRVDYSTKTSLSGAKSVSTTAARTELTGLAAGTTYYLRVRAVTAKAQAGKATSTLKVTTLAKGGYSDLAPTGLKHVSRSTTSVSLQWSAVGTGRSYEVQLSSSSKFTTRTSITATAASTRFVNVRAGATYYARVRVVTTAHKPASQYSATLKLTTKAYPYKPLTAVKRLDSATTALAVGWSAQPGAYRYRVRYSTSSAMTNAQISYTSTNRVELTGLKPGARYYVQARVVADNLDALNNYSTAVALSTPKSGHSFLAPTGLRLTELSSTSVALDWATRGTSGYQVVVATNSALTGAFTITSDASSATVTGLKPRTHYWVAVRVVSSSGAALSANSTRLSLTTEPSGKAVVRVASYNVRCHYCSDTPMTNERPWTERRSGIVATILDQHPDVVGLQEASQTRLIGADGKALKVSQFDDIVNRLGSPYKITNPYRYNCVNGYSASKCTAKARGASKGTKIIYNSSTVKLVSQGTQRLTSPKGKYRYAVWAVFTDRASGKSFFFVNTHLEYEKDTAGSTYFYDLRRTQAADLVALIKARNKGLPVVITGDFNSSKKTVPDNAPYDVVTQAGFVDPLGNGYQSTSPSNATVQKRIRTNYNSYNGYALDPPKSGNVNGTYVDYLFTSASVSVPEWETVLNLDSKGRQQGVIPSDHNMIRATVELT